MQTIFGIRVDGSRQPDNVAGKWSAAKYERAIKHWLDRIMCTGTGRAVIRSLKPGEVLIQPDDKHRTPSAGPQTNTSEALATGIRSGAVFRSNRGLIIGKGGGTTASVELTPEDFFNSPPQEQPDMVLIHELAHASRWNAGKVSKAPMLRFGFLTREEVHAVLIGNMYRSEQDLNTFRLSHRPKRFGTLLQAQATFDLGHDLIRLLASRQPQLYRCLAEIKTRFNPVAKAMSKGR